MVTSHGLVGDGIANIINTTTSRVILARLALNIRGEGFALVLVVGQTIIAINLGVVRQVVNAAGTGAARKGSG